MKNNGVGRQKNNMGEGGFRWGAPEIKIRWEGRGAPEIKIWPQEIKNIIKNTIQRFFPLQKFKVIHHSYLLIFKTLATRVEAGI